MSVLQIIKAAGGMHIECPMSGSVKPAEQGKLIFLASGDEELFELSKPLLAVMGCKNVFLAQAGTPHIPLRLSSFIGLNIAIYCAH